MTKLDAEVLQLRQREKELMAALSDRTRAADWFRDRALTLEQQVTQQAAIIQTLVTALTKLANEASGFKSMADPLTHGHTNMAVLGLRIDEARNAALQASIPREQLKK